MNLRIALFTGNYDLVVDGVSLTLNRLVRYLERKGHDVLIFAPTSADARRGRTESLVPAASVPIPGRSEYRIAGRLQPAHRSTLESFDPHLVHLATPDLLGVTALQWARKRGTPAVATYHTHFPAYLTYYRLGIFEPIMLRYLRWFYRRCTEIYVPTPAVARFLEEIGVRTVLRLWGRGVDSDRFNPSLRSESWRRRYGVREDEVLIAFVGRLVKEKGVTVFAEVVERLHDEKLPVRAMIVGDGPLRSALESALPDAIFPGFLQDEELSRAYACSDVFLYPSDSEAFGNVIVEAMASGLPVVCAASSGSSSHVDAGKTGFLAPPRAVEEFLERTRTLVLSADLRLRIGDAARVHATSYSWERTLDTMLGYYRNVVGEEMRLEDVPRRTSRPRTISLPERPEVTRFQ